MDNRLEDYRKQHCIFVPLLGLERGRLTHHGLTGITPKSKDFFSKGIGLLPFPSMQMPYSEDPLRRLHPTISRSSSKNRRIPILRDKPIELIKWRQTGLEDLLINPCLKRRIRERAIRDYQMGEHQNPPHPFNVAPTYLQQRNASRVEGFRQKSSGQKNI